HERAGEAEGIPFQLNARTDAFVRGGDRPREVILDDAIARGTAYLEAGASTVFVPGPIDRAAAEQLVGAFGPGRLNVIGVPGALTAQEYEELGVARISYGPWTQNVALTALKNLAVSLYDGGAIPESTEKLN
ncbi:isocitrate lyase/phosphoenolpyruvate mutase family protein, partial [Xanthomonas perforans]